MTSTESRDRRGDGEARTHSGRRTWLWVTLGAAAVAAVAIVVALVLTSGNGGDAEPAAAANTSTVRRVDLVVTETLAGTLGYGETETIAFRTGDDGVDTVPGGLSGVVTDAPEEGAVVEAGDVLYEVNGRPVVVLYGDTPVYRTLNRRTGDGSDVRALEQSLVDLGYDPDGDIEIDEEFTTATEDAIELLQEEIGATVDGSFDLGEMLFTAGPTYVAESLVDDGDQIQGGQAIVALSQAPRGTFTSIAEEGAIVGQGSELYHTDGRPTVLMLGAVPVYRALGLGSEGDDVAQLQRALGDLGFAGDELVEGEFDDATLAAVVAWQASIGAQPDGIVNVGEVVFLPNSIRVGERLVSIGDVAGNGTPVLATSASTTFVTVQLATGDRSLVAEGDAVEVELPDGSIVPATVTSIGTVAQAAQGQGGDSYFDMTVTLDDPDSALGLDEAPVDVDIITDSATQVLAVPVTALLALAEGGYALEVADADGTTRLVGVETGLFADGFVEVAGNVQAGDTVVVP